MTRPGPRQRRGYRRTHWWTTDTRNRLPGIRPASHRDTHRRALPTPPKLQPEVMRNDHHCVQAVDCSSHAFPCCFFPRYPTWPFVLFRPGIRTQGQAMRGWLLTLLRTVWEYDGNRTKETATGTGMRTGKQATQVLLGGKIIERLQRSLFLRPQE